MAVVTTTAAPRQIELTSAAVWASSCPAALSADQSSDFGAQAGAGNCPCSSIAMLMPAWQTLKPRAPTGTRVGQLVRQFSGEAPEAVEAAAAGLRRRSAAAAAVRARAAPATSVGRVRELARLFEAPPSPTTTATTQAEAAAAPLALALKTPSVPSAPPTTERRVSQRRQKRRLSLAERLQVLLCLLLALFLSLCCLFFPFLFFVFAGLAVPVLMSNSEINDFYPRI